MLRFTYGNDPEIWSISIMEKVPEIRNFGTISGTISSHPDQIRRGLSETVTVK